MTMREGELPLAAQETLKAASKVGQPGSFERAKAINRALEKVRSTYPQFFRKEP